MRGRKCFSEGTSSACFALLDDRLGGGGHSVPRPEPEGRHPPLRHLQGCPRTWQGACGACLSRSCRHTGAGEARIPCAAATGGGAHPDGVHHLMAGSSSSWSASALPTTTGARTRPSSSAWSPRPVSPVRKPRLCKNGVQGCEKHSVDS